MKKSHKPSQVLYSEEQRFRQWWLWALMGTVAIGATIPIYQTMTVSDGDWGDKAVTISVSSLIVLIGSTYLYAFNLKTSITQEGISVKIGPFPLINRFIPFSEMQKCYVRQYHPLAEYGGWGVKGSRKNRVYNISGDEGLQIEFRDGKKLLIGTQKSEEINTLLYKLGVVKV